MSGGLRVALVGPMLQENLALEYLAAAVEQAGHEAEIVAYDDRSCLARAVSGVLESAPDLVGVGIAFQRDIEDSLAFVASLREHGYRGHVTCGGHVPTFCHTELLRDAPGLDTAVRHDGEQTLVEMLDMLGRGESPRALPGLVWREGAAVVAASVRRPAPIDTLARPKRGTEPYLVGGVAIDFLITGRGCVGECSYCSIAAFSAETGLRFRLRDPDDVADEIADLYTRRGTRVFFVQDDLFVLPREKKATERIAAVTAGLRRRGVREAAFWVKGRPETITDSVCSAAREMGTIHVFTGVESASPERLEYLGRTHLPAHNVAAIERCLAHGITPSFNFMLFDPDAALADVATTLDLAERFVDLPWNFCRTEVYSGTKLEDRLALLGRLEGDYRCRGYRMRDEAAEVMFRIVRVALHERALAVTSLLNRLISLSFARQIHERFFPGKTTDELSSAARALDREVRADTLARLRAALAFAKNARASERGAIGRFAVEQGLAIGERDLAFRWQSRQLWDALGVRGERRMERMGVRPARAARSDFRVVSGS